MSRCGTHAWSSPRWAIAIALLVGCDDASTPAGTPAASAEPAATKPALLEPAEAEAVRDRLQGTWSMSWWRGDFDPHPEVWSIAGDTLTRWDGTKEETAELTLLAPCLMKAAWDSGSYTLESFVVDGDDIYFNQQGGRTEGDRTVVCGQDAAWLLEDGTCRVWKQAMLRLANDRSLESATCSLAADGAFEADGKRFPRRGDVFVSENFEQVRAKPATRFASLAEAKAALAPAK